jgi:hypothetical protein
MTRRSGQHRRVRMVFCPHGHNAYETNERAPECGACGAIMSEDADDFNDALEIIEDRGIAEAERELSSEDDEWDDFLDGLEE